MANSFVRYTGNGSTTAYAVPFSYVSQTHVAITISGVANTAFTWNGAGTEITFDSAPADESNIEIRRTTSQTVRLVDYTSGSVLTETDLDTDSTQAFYMGQEAVDDANDVIKTSSSTFQWDGSSKRITNVTDPTGAQDAATKNYTDTAGTSQVTLATTQATNAATSATAAATSATGAATSATNAATSATNAATSATTATTKATAAATSATNSATSATTSTTQATTATTQASAASTSATNAATSATAAAASADSFDDTYLGAKSSAPTVDNDGDALTTGDLYFNTTNNKMYFRTSSAWESFTTVTTALTVADESSDATCFPLFVTAATGDLPPKSGSNLAFNSSSGLLTATGFSGALTGNVTGNASGSSGSTTGNAATATALASARTIGGVSFDGTGNISLPGVNTGGNQDTSGTAADATVLETARTIGGVSFNGSGNIDLPGVNTAGNQATSGLAATTTALASARTIGGVSFDGTGNIDLPGVNTSGNQNTSGTAAGLSATLVTGSGGTGLTGAVVGKQTIWIPAAAMYPNTTAGCAALAQVELSMLIFRALNITTSHC